MPDGNAIRTQRTRARILAESLALFNEHDEARVTTGMIAAAAGISPGNLHYHFRTREAIVQALFDAFEHDAGTAPAPSRSGAEAIEDLWLYLHLMLEGIQRYRFLYRDLEGLPRRDARLARRLRGVLERQRQAIAELLSSLVRARAMRASPREIDAIAANVLVVASFWRSFRATLDNAPGEQPRTPGQGAYQVMMLVVPYLAGDARRLIERLGRSYID